MGIQECGISEYSLTIRAKDPDAFKAMPWGLLKVADVPTPFCDPPLMAPLPPARVPTNQSRGEELGVGDSEGVPEEEPVGDPVCVGLGDPVDVGLGNARNT